MRSQGKQRYAEYRMIIINAADASGFLLQKQESREGNDTMKVDGGKEKIQNSNLEEYQYVNYGCYNITKALTHL